jgi:hypothetical protein
MKVSRTPGAAVSTDLASVFAVSRRSGVPFTEEEIELRGFLGHSLPMGEDAFDGDQCSRIF